MQPGTRTTKPKTTGTGAGARLGTRSTVKKKSDPKTGLKRSTEEEKVEKPKIDRGKGRRKLTIMSKNIGIDADGVSANKSDSKNKQGEEVGEEDLVLKKYAFKTQTGIVPGNPDKINQDIYIIVQNFARQKNQYLLSVCDGHGLAGHDVSGTIKTKLPVVLAADQHLANNPSKALTNSFRKVNSEILRASYDTEYSGSTNVTVLLRGSKILCANSGDSRAVMGKFDGSEWSSLGLSRDHKPTEPDEAARIKKSNGRIEPFTDEYGNFLGPERVWLKYEDSPGLAMTRSFGDSVGAKCGVICDPEIKEFDVDDECKFMILGSDGVWEFIDNDEAVEMVKPFYEKNDAAGAVDFLVEESTKRWQREEEVTDDITCVVAFF